MNATTTPGKQSDIWELPSANTFLELNMLFVGCVVLAVVTLIAAIVVGAAQFHNPIGKIVAITAGVLLIALAVFVGAVLYLAWNASNGMPL